MFSHIEKAPADPILGLSEAFKNDPHAKKVNLAVGVYKDEQGITPVMQAVKQAEALLLKEEKTKSYLPILGDPAYTDLIPKLIFNDPELLTSGRIRSMQTPGGTGALFVAADFFRHHHKSPTIWICAPTWPNHHNIFNNAGFTIKTYPYYDADNQSLALEAMLQTLQSVQQGDIVLFHGACHNPTGIDPTLEEWQKIAAVIAQQAAFPLFDFAYQGFGKGLTADAAVINLFAKRSDELFVASSYSKNFGLYNERIGALTLLAKTKKETDATMSQLALVARKTYSNPPAHGAKIISTILQNAELKIAWKTELEQMRQRITSVRLQLADKLHSLGLNFDFLKTQQGMFGYTGLSADQVKVMIETFHIYLVGSGRINIASIDSSNIDTIVEAIARVVVQ